MHFLQYWYGNRQDIILLQEAAGANPGEVTMFVSTRNPTVTSLSQSWIDKVRQEDSFARVKWDQQMEVKVTTLDQLIQDYGVPAICKIDVEGYELRVLQGLSYPIPTISFEYIPAAISLAQDCVLQLSEIGNYRYNWSSGESYQMKLSTWLSANEMIAEMSHKLRSVRSGDIYARLFSD